MKRIISVVLSLVFVFSFCVPVSATGEQADYNGDPIVVVRGIDFAGLVKDDGSKAITVDAFDVFNLVLDIGSYKAKGDEDATIKAIVQFGNNLFNDIDSDCHLDWLRGILLFGHVAHTDFQGSRH